MQHHHPHFYMPKAMESFISLVLLLSIFVSFVHPKSQQIEEISGTPSSIISEEELVQIKPDPPENLRIKVYNGTQVYFFWDSPISQRLFTHFVVQLEDLNLSKESPSLISNLKREFFVEETNLELNEFLRSGGSYNVRIYSKFNSQLSKDYLEANFTTKPNQPEKLIVWYRNETALLIYWQPPSGIFEDYKVEISPKETPDWRLIVPQEKYQEGEVQPGFFHLTPGREYSISLVTRSQGEESDPLVMEYRTLPLKPQNLSITQMDPSSSGIIVDWVPPASEEGEFDGFSVSINHLGYSSIQKKFIPRTKPSRALLEEKELEPGKMYEVSVKTVSGRVSSSKISRNFTFLPFFLPLEQTII